jgi:hypothetical protein
MWHRVLSRFWVFTVAATIAVAIEGSIYTAEAFRRQAEIVVCEFYGSCYTNFKWVPDCDFAPCQLTN